MTTPVLVGLTEIAEIAGVSRPAVSNWRKRYDDFPEPRVQSDAGALFDLREVEEWLLARGKLERPIPPGTMLWRFADHLRGTWSSELLTDFIISWLVFLDAEDAVAKHGTNAAVDIPDECRLDSILGAEDDRLAVALRSAAKEIETRNESLQGLLNHLAPDPFPPASVRLLVAELDAATDDITTRVALFEEAVQRGVELGGRAAGETTSPDDLAYLMNRLASPIPIGGTVVDPACGTGGLLLMAALVDTTDLVADATRFVGVDINEHVARRARARCFLYGVPADIRTADALELAPEEWPPADAVLLDPPWGRENWGTAELYRSARWTFGAPPPRSDDLAWVQIAVGMLKPTGRAVLSLPTGSLIRGGTEAEIREALVTAGVVEAIIELPPRMRTNSSLPVALWLLRSPTTSPHEVLMVDASNLGTAGRSTHSLEEDDIEHIVRLVNGWRDRQVLPDDASQMAAAVDAALLVSGEVNLTPRRYLQTTQYRSLEALRQAAEDARADVRVALERAQLAAEALANHGRQG